MSEKYHHSISSQLNFECQNLSLSFKQKTIFNDFNFSFKGPGIIFIEGENASGKTSLLKIFAGYIIPNAGEILYHDVPINQYSSEKKMSYLATSSLGLLNELTGKEQVELIARILNLDSADLQKKIENFSMNILFNEILNQPISIQSQGMKQLLRLFIHFLPNSEVFFLDEPFLYLSPSNRSFIQKKIEQVAQKSLIFITDQKVGWVPQVKYEKISLGTG